MSKSITGIVSSKSSDKTIIVKIERRKTHPIYHKQYSESKKIMAHDEKNIALVGDKVEIEECRPLSKRKHFSLVKIIEKPDLRDDSLEVIKPQKIEPKEKKK